VHLNLSKRTLLRVLMAVLVSPGPAAAAAPQTYYWLVFNRPVAGHEAEFNNWYDNEHAPAVVAVPGFVQAQRFILCDQQLRPISRQRPRYLIVYKIVTANLPSVFAEVDRRMQGGQIKLSPALDMKSLQTATYRVFRPAITGAGARLPGVAAEPARKYVQLVFADPADGLESDFNRWYDHVHAPEVAAVPGFVGAQRLVRGDAQLGPAGDRQKYLIMFKIVSADVGAVIADFQRRMPDMHMSKAFDGERAFGYTYQSLGPVIGKTPMPHPGQ
jgi:hypothetical protein